MITNLEYQKIRTSIGSQRDVSRELGVDIRTVQRREAGEILITHESTRALFCLSALRRLRNLKAEVDNNGIKGELDNIATLLEAY